MDKHSIDASHSSRKPSSISPQSSEGANNYSTGSAIGKHKGRTISPVPTESVLSTSSTNPSMIADYSSTKSQELTDAVTADQAPSVKTGAPTANAPATEIPAVRKSYNSFMKWLTDIDVENKNKLTTEMYNKDINRLKSLKESDLTKEFNVPEDVSIDKLPKAARIYKALKSIILLLVGGLGGIIPFLMGNPQLLFAMFIVIIVLVVVALCLEEVPESNDYTKITNLDQVSVKTGITNMIQAVFKKMDTNKTDSFEYEDIQKKLKKIITKGNGFKKANKLNNLIKYVSNHSDKKTLNDIELKKYINKIGILTKEMFESLFTEIENEIQDQDLLTSFVQAKQQYFKMLTENGFKTEATMEFSYLLAHNLCPSKPEIYYRDKINPIVDSGIQAGIKKYAKSIAEVT